MAELRLLTVHAHADDETLTLGGTLSRYADEGVATCLVTCTDGELATIYAPDMVEDEVRPRLGEIRREEMRAAAAVLRIGEVHFLGYHDSGMAGAGTNQRPEAFWRASLDEVVGRLVERIRAFRPQVVVTYDANGGYGHPDHIQTHRATVLAVEAAAHPRLYVDGAGPWRTSKLYYTAFPVSLVRRIKEFTASAGLPDPFGDGEAAEEMIGATPDEAVTTRVDTRGHAGRVQQALRAHRSQIAPDFPMLATPEAALTEVFPHESFQLAWSHVPTSFPESDLFAGIR